MKIRSKEQFFLLYVCMLAQNGYKVITCDFEHDFLPFLKDLKYADLFSFFESRRDFDFSSLLVQLQENHLLHFIPRDKDITIQLANALFYADGPKILQNYDKRIKGLMQDLIQQMELNYSLSRILPSNIHGNYHLVNPNRSYSVTNDQKIVTDGDVVMINSDGTYIVEGASYLFLIKILPENSYQIEVYYEFIDERYLKQLISKTSKDYISSLNTKDEGVYLLK